MREGESRFETNETILPFNVFGERKRRERKERNTQKGLCFCSEGRFVEIFSPFLPKTLSKMGRRFLLVPKIPIRCPTLEITKKFQRETWLSPFGTIPKFGSMDSNRLHLRSSFSHIVWPKYSFAFAVVYQS